VKKKLLVLSLLIAFVAAMVFNRKENTAKPVQFSVSIGDQKVKKGDQFTVYIKVNSDVELKKINAYLEYNAAALQFVKADSDKAVGTDGVLYINEEFENPVKSVEYAVTMQASEVGISEFAIHDLYLEDAMNSDVIEVGQTSAAIEVIENTKQESDAALSELMVFPGTLIPAFDPEVDTYEVEVSAATEELILSAVPAVEESVVGIEQPEKLQPGKNQVTVTVTSPSGSTKQYHITVDRAK